MVVLNCLVVYGYYDFSVFMFDIFICCFDVDDLFVCSFLICYVGVVMFFVVVIEGSFVCVVDCFGVGCLLVSCYV